MIAGRESDALRTCLSSGVTRLELFGVRAIRGRDFSVEDAVGNARVPLISFDAWQHRFAAAEDIVGRQIYDWPDANAVEIVGVLPDHFMRQTLAPVLVGALAGLCGAYWAGSYLQSFLHEVDARDPATLTIVVFVLLAATALGGWLPARRAGRLDPVAVLRMQ